MTRLRLAWRLARLTVHLLAGLATCALVFPWASRRLRDGATRRWSRRLLAICNVRVEAAPGSAPLEHALFVANHISWLDIFVINSVRPCRFVAKSDIRDWPVIGWLCAATGTIFLTRGNRRDVRRIYEGLVTSIRAGERIAFFPEGGVASQGAMLPFHANLFEAAIEAGVPVQPLALRYVDQAGDFHPAADFTGDMTFMQSFLLILKSPPMQVDLILLPPIDTAGAHRRDLATIARRAVEEGLAKNELD